MYSKYATQFLDLCLLVGCDYISTSVKGLGIATAHKLVERHRSLDKVSWEGLILALSQYDIPRVIISVSSLACKDENSSQFVRRRVLSVRVLGSTYVEVWIMHPKTSRKSATPPLGVVVIMTREFCFQDFIIFLCSQMHMSPRRCTSRCVDVSPCVDVHLGTNVPLSCSAADNVFVERPSLVCLLCYADFSALKTSLCVAPVQACSDPNGPRRAGSL